MKQKIILSFGSTVLYDSYFSGVQSYSLRKFVPDNIFYLLEIKNPSDNLVYSLIMKFFSDNQVVIRKEIVENIVKKIDRSYLRIDDFLTKLNKLSIIKKKKIDYKTVKNKKINVRDFF